MNKQTDNLMKSTNQKGQKEKPHYYGHRRRLRKRFVKKGMSSFADYEVVEMLLTYVVRRIDTKPLAKKLLKQFGSIAGLLDANMDSLQKEAKIAENTAILIKFIRAVITRYFESTLPKSISFATLDELVPYLQAFFGEEQKRFLKFFI